MKLKSIEIAVRLSKNYNSFESRVSADLTEEDLANPSSCFQKLREMASEETDTSMSYFTNQVNETKLKY